MSRDEFLGLIDRALADDLISRSEYSDLLDAYDAGELPIDPPAIPAEEIRRPSAAAYIGIALWIYAMMHPGQQPPADRPLAASTSAALQSTARAGRLALAERLQDRMVQASTQAARRLAAGQITLQEWQRTMGTLIDRHVTAQTMAGSRSAQLTAEQIARIEQIILQERAYLSRFADTIAIRSAAGRPLSIGQIASRARSYAGTGRGEYYRAEETAAAEAGEEGDGWVYDYVSRDDGGTCGPCIEADADGPYLSGEGPYPGQVCLGRDNCRCHRSPRYDTDAWAHLTGREPPT